MKKNIFHRKENQKMSNRKSNSKVVPRTSASKTAKTKTGSKTAKTAPKDAVKIVGRAVAKKSAAPKKPKQRRICLDDVDEATYQFYCQEAEKRGVSVEVVASAFLAKLADRLRENRAAKGKR